jgi:hypothetical protein
MFLRIEEWKELGALAMIDPEHHRCAPAERPMINDGLF